MVIRDKLNEKGADELLKPFINNGTNDYIVLAMELSK